MFLHFWGCCSILYIQCMVINFDDAQILKDFTFIQNSVNVLKLPPKTSWIYMKRLKKLSMILFIFKKNLNQFSSLFLLKFFIIMLINAWRDVNMFLPIQFDILMHPAIYARLFICVMKLHMFITRWLNSKFSCIYFDFSLFRPVPDVS